MSLRSRVPRFILETPSDFTLLPFTFFNRTQLFQKYLQRVSLIDDFPPPPSSPPPHCPSLPPSLLLRRSALEEINRRWSHYKSSAPRFPIHSPPHSSPPLSTAHYLCRPSAFLLFLLISRFLSRANSGKAPTGCGPREGTGRLSPLRTLGTRRVHT